MASAVLSFLAVSALDYATGDIGVSIFYLAPIYSAVMGGGLRLGIATGLACSAMIFALDHLVSGSNGALVLWDDFMKLGFLLAIAVLLSRLREALEEERKTNEELDIMVRARTAQVGLAAGELQVFNYALAHHLRAPLRGIAGLSRQLRENLESALDGKQKDKFERIRVDAARLDALIDGLLAVTGLPISDVRRQLVDLSALAADLVDELRSAAPERRVRVVIEGGLRENADPRLLSLALRCLLQNAWKFTSGLERAEIEVGARREGAETVYFVRDNGAGFDMAYCARLFQPFQRLHAPHEYPGLGIGLTLVHQVISRHGGRAWAVGEAGRGATVYFTLEPKG